MLVFCVCFKFFNINYLFRKINYNIINRGLAYTYTQVNLFKNWKLKKNGPYALCKTIFSNLNKNLHSKHTNYKQLKTL